jgi:N4-gp56 family major capsid protein
MCHSDLKADLEHLTGWTKVVEYGNPSDAVPGEIGACEGVRFCISRFVTPWLASGASATTFLTNGIAGTGAVDVYPIVIVGRDAYGVVRLQGRKSGVQMFICNPGNASPGNELGQKGSVGYRLPWAGAILNEYAVARIECAATANPNW